MSTSGVTNFTVTRDQVIQAALRGLSVLEEGAEPTAAATSNASFALNLIIKNWQKDGIKLWTIDNLEVPLVANQTVYNIGPDSSNDIVSDRPLRVIQGFLRNVEASPPIDIPLQPLSRQEYNILGSKFSPGVMNSYFYNPKPTFGQLTVYLTPDTNSQTNYVLYVIVQRPIMDMVKPTDNFDFPNEWFLALKWALMAELAPEYDKSLPDRGYYDARAVALKKALEDWDVENASMFFQPDVRMGMNRSFR